MATGNLPFQYLYRSRQFLSKLPIDDQVKYEENMRDLEEFLARLWNRTSGGTDFGSSNWSLFGSATLFGPGVVQLTADGGGTQAGSMFYNTTIASSGFHAEFDFKISGSGGHADGLAFVMLYPDEIARFGQTGGGIGFWGLDCQAVMWDTFDNGDGYTEPAIAGVGEYDAGPRPSSAAYDITSSLASFFDVTHEVVVDYTGGIFTVSMDATEYINQAITLPSMIRPGFTASTGGSDDQHLLSNLHDISWD